MIPAPPVYRHTTHLLHFLLCFCTFGFWIFGWIIVTLLNRSENERLQADYEKRYAYHLYQVRQHEQAVRMWEARQLWLAVQSVRPVPPPRQLHQVPGHRRALTR